MKKLITSAVLCAAMATAEMCIRDREIPSSIDIIVTSQGRRIRTIMNYDENIGDSSIYQQNYEQSNFPNLK